MSTKYKKKARRRRKCEFKEKRVTVQARINKKWYLLLKQEAVGENITISKLLDSVLLYYFGKNAWKKARDQAVDYKK